MLAAGQPVEKKTYDSLKWRCIGPFRGGRTVGASGVKGRPNEFYIGVNNGGVWKSTDYGRVWVPIFDDQPTGSIGALAVSESHPDTVYVGTGEGLHRPDLSIGNGMYKSTDAGKTWSYLGLPDIQQIGDIIIDPKNPDRVFVAGLGHPYGPNEERGVFRTVDGGKTWDKVLYKDENTGAIALEFDPRNPNVLFAALWEERHGPWENSAWPGPNSGLFKSTDGGKTWRHLTKGLPTFAEGLGRIGFTISLSKPNLMFALVDASPQQGGLYRSDDAGESWTKVNGEDRRIWSRGSDFAEIDVDPRNPDILYSSNVTALRSLDGGKNFEAWRGAPGGDDYHTLWINPENPQIMIFASDQGAIITVNGGQTFSSWYNQPTAQFYHVSTDNQFPYWVYGGQQESGSVAVSSRGSHGQITFRDWYPVGVEEYGYVAPDPLDPNFVYGGKITKFDRRTGQVQNISPEITRSGKYRFIRTMPVIFSPADPRTLFFAGNVLFKTTSGGNSWDVISPDLTRETYDVSESIGAYWKDEMKTMPRRGVIYSVAPSHQNVNTIWAGTDDGLIHLTRDGGQTWKNVTPPQLDSWSKVSQLDAGHFDDNTCYAAINRFRLDDLEPHIYKTHNGGQTWERIVNGLPKDPINTVREDPKVKGVLYCGSETAVYFSIDDGKNWNPLRLNMPATSIRDLVIKDDDVVVGTHGRSFWILDNITPIRWMARNLGQPKILYPPQVAYRVRWNNYTDTPMPQEEPAGQNPPDGAIIDYYLPKDAKKVTLQFLYGAASEPFTSDDPPRQLNPQDFAYPTYWIRPEQRISNKAGAHRFVWNMRLPALPGRPHHGINAIYQNSPTLPVGPWVRPGPCMVRLIVDGKVYTERFEIRMDPNVKLFPADIQAIDSMSVRAYDLIVWALILQNDAAKLREGWQKDNNQAKLTALDEFLNGKQGEANAISVARLTTIASALLARLQGADMPPTQNSKDAMKELDTLYSALQVQWERVRG